MHKFRARFSERGYTCDLCGREVFEYPKARLCRDCEKKIPKNDKLCCPVCGRKTITDGVCLNCKASRPVFEKGLSPFVYDGLAASAINRLKNGQRYLAFLLAERMAETFLREIEDAANKDNAVIVCVPMTEKSKRKRGYNQAAELARIVSELSGIPFREDLLVKTKETSQQKKMTARERVENVAGAFRVHERKECRGKICVLVDDIMTTGATGNELSRLLYGAEARSVIFLTAASLSERK